MSQNVDVVRNQEEVEFDNFRQGSLTELLIARPSCNPAVNAEECVSVDNDDRKRVSQIELLKLHNSQPTEDQKNRHIVQC